MPSAKRKRQFQRMGSNGAARARATNRYPLRRVINEFAEFEPGVPAFELECGHNRLLKTERGQLLPIETFCGISCSRCKRCGRHLIWNREEKRWVVDHMLDSWGEA